MPTMSLSTKRLFFWFLATIAMLSIPLVATILSSDVTWDLTDFGILGSVLFSIGLIYELIIRKSDRIIYRAAFGIALLGAFLLLWVNGAVGIIGNEGQPANYLFGLVFLVGIIGALWSRFKPKGMALTLFVAATVQMLIPTIAFMIWPPPGTSWSPGVLGVFYLSAFFALLFAISGFLFRRASIA